MGSTICSSIAQLIIEDLEDTVIANINYVKFYTRYVGELY